MIYNKGTNELTADSGMVLRRKSDGVVFGDTIRLGATHYISGVKLESPRMEQPDDYEDYKVAVEPPETSDGSYEEPDASPCEPPYTEILEAKKKDKIMEIEKYNVSPDVDGFLLNGTRHWLSLEERKSAKLSTDAHVTLGHETTEQYLDGKIYTIPCQTLLLMLAQLEVYALQCYNNALRQKAEVEAMTDIEEVQRYDVRNGYPEQLSFNI